MTERYDDAVQGLREVAVPDQWDEILARAARPADPGTPGTPRRDRAGDGQAPRRWPLALAVAATVAVIVGTIALVNRSGTDVSTSDRPAATPTAPSTAPSQASTATTPTTSAPPATGALPNDVVDIDTYPVSACRGLRFTATAPPAGIASTMQPVALDDPRVPSAVHGNLTGVFPSDAETRAVFVVAGWPGLQDDGGTYVGGPFPGVQSWISAYDEGWLAEIAAPAAAGTYCPFTLIGLGLDEPELGQFLAGLALEG